MKKALRIIFFILTTASIAACSSTKSVTALKPTTAHLAGRWTISDININVPAGFRVTNVFDEAPYPDFKGSTWDLTRNGKGSFTLTNGKKEDIYWSIYGKGNNAQFQFKKLNGRKPKNVEEGYLLRLGAVTSNNFTAQSAVNTGNDSTGSIIYTFTKK